MTAPYPPPQQPMPDRPPGEPPYQPFPPPYQAQQPPFQQPYQPQTPFQQPYQPQTPPFPPQRGGAGRGTIIALVSVVGVLALACLAGVAGVFWYLRDDKPGTSTPKDISGVIDYRAEHPEWLAREHRAQDEKITYPMKPSAGGPHHQVWQKCQGDVYTAPVDEGNATHSLEHGAVWITYRTGLPAGDVEKLAKRVRGNDYMLMSPYEGQPTPVSLQAWGYQLQVSSVDDERIDAFIQKYRQTASMEPGVPCSTGTTATEGG